MSISHQRPLCASLSDENRVKPQREGVVKNRSSQVKRPRGESGLFVHEIPGEMDLLTP
jgi:hypothetical protein